MTSLNQWAVLVTLKNVENRSCCDCKVPLTKSDAYCSSYGIWVCSKCAEVHKSLVIAEHVWFRHALNDQLSETEIDFLLHDTNISTSGNTGFNELYERHIPSGWVKLSPNCNPKERVVWIRAKYTVELFRIPNDKIGGDFASTLNLRGGAPPTKKKKRGDVNPAVLPARIVDYFLVVSATASTTKIDEVSPTLESIANLPVVPTIQTCYPPSDTYPDMTMPELLAPFLFPAGVELSTVEKQPSFFTFVLTDVSGVKLYGAVMHVHELLEPLDLLPELGLPASFASAVTSGTAAKLWPVVYVPKALVVLSHYPFFHLYRQFLVSLYHVSLSPSLLPLERYVINFFSETPLPPPGFVEVNFAINPRKVVQVTRPRRNQLPMVDFSFRPLFMLLSVDNIVTVVSALCSELPVCVISEHVALLTPVCEALLSFLFPFTWQGAYIPVLPEHMTEILDAPVPYLMGMQRTYFDRNAMSEVRNRPALSVFVDLDNNSVLLGRAEDLFGCDDDDAELMQVQMPHSKLLSKLKPKLVEFGGCIHRCSGYKEHIEQFGVAYPGNEHLVPLEGLTDPGNTGTGINLVHKDSSSRLSSGKRGTFFKSSPGPLPATPEAGVAEGTTSNVNTSGSQEYCTRLISSSAKPHVFDPQFNNHCPADAFNSQELRFAFLRMFVALLIDYQDFIEEPTGAAATDQNMNSRGGESATRPSFDRDRFLVHCGGDEFLKDLLVTQMLDKFMQEKLSSLDSEFTGTAAAENMEVRYFDESILSKNNRSMIKFKKSSTPFLSDMSDAVAETCTSPTPNHWGIPLNAEPYSYGKFPTKLNAAFCTPVRPPRRLVKEGSEITRANDQGSKTANMISNTIMHRKQSQIDRAESESEPVSEVFGSDAAMDVYLGEARLAVLTVKKWVTQLQATVRMRRQRRVFLARFEELTRLMNMVALKTRIHNFVRMACCRIRFRKCRFAVLRLQASWRASRDFKLYRRTLVHIVRIQSCFRRHRLVKTQWARNMDLISAIRGHLVGMWNAGTVPLIERSRFWHFANVLASTQFAGLVGGAHAHRASYRRFFCCYTALAVHAAEFNRVFTALGWGAREGRASVSEHSYARLADRLVLVDSLIAGAPTPAAAAAKALASERDELYKIMKTAMDDNSATAKTALFAAFQLGVTKKRKQALSQALWTDTATGSADARLKQSDVSARVVLKIQFTHDTTVYSAAKVDAAAMTSLATFIRIAKEMDAGSTVPVNVSQLDQLWLLGAYCARVARASAECAALTARSMAEAASRHRELRLREAECVALKEGSLASPRRRRRSTVGGGFVRKDSSGTGHSRGPSVDTRAGLYKEGSLSGNFNSR